MTVIDEVLQAEKAAAQTIEEAKVEATKVVADARVNHDAVLQAESVKLAEHEVAALASHAQSVEQKAKGITDAVAKEVSAIEQKFSQKSSDIKAKIKQSLA